jgi:GNAT superfamily N-acetyltransferase
VPQLAQLNIARLLAPLDDPRLEGFVNNLDRVNALGDASPGFVWRLQTDDGDATALRPFPDPDIIVNLTVWESVESLRAFAYRGEHLGVFKQRREWFEERIEPMVVLWWVAEGHIPGVDEAKERLEFLRRHGPSPWAFPFSALQPPLLVERATVSDAAAARLIEELNADIMATHAEGDHFWGLTVEDVAPGRGAFFVLRLDGEPAGCGAVRKLGEDEAELKRMYVRPAFRGRKLGAVLVDALEAEARSLGVSRLLLETALYLEAAVRVYERAGFTPIPQFGEYVGASDSYCMGKTLT